MENINEFIDYSGIFKEVVKTHLDMYPNWMDYVEDFLGKNQFDENKNSKELYQIISNLDEFDKQNEGVCLETSSLDTDANKCTVAFYIDNSTSTENGFDADFYLWIFKIDLLEGVITGYSNDY